MSVYFVRYADGQVEESVSLDVLRYLVSKGRLSRDDQVRESTSPLWFPAVGVPGLFSHHPLPAPPSVGDMVADRPVSEKEAATTREILEELLKQTGVFLDKLPSTPTTSTPKVVTDVEIVPTTADDISEDRLARIRRDMDRVRGVLQNMNRQQFRKVVGIVKSWLAVQYLKTALLLRPTTEKCLGWRFPGVLISSLVIGSLVFIWRYSFQDALLAGLSFGVLLAFPLYVLNETRALVCLEQYHTKLRILLGEYRTLDKQIVTWQRELTDLKREFAYVCAVRDGRKRREMRREPIIHPSPPTTEITPEQWIGGFLGFLKGCLGAVFLVCLGVSLMLLPPFIPIAIGFFVAAIISPFYCSVIGFQNPRTLR